MTQTLEQHPPTAAKPLLTIRASSGWSALNLAEVWQFRDLVWTLAGRDIKLRYKQTALGVAWVIIQPLLAAGILTVVFGIVAQLGSRGSVPTFVLIYAGQLGWGLFVNTLTKASGSMVGNAHLVSKVYFPRLALPISTIFANLIDFGVALLLMIPMIAIWGKPGTGIFMLPVCMVILLMLAIGIGLTFSALMVSYRDVQFVLPVMVQLFMYASPVMYELDWVRTRLAVNYPVLARLYMLNPLASLIETFRWSLLGQGDPDWKYLGYSAALAVVLFLWGAFTFKRMERKFADVV